MKVQSWISYQSRLIDAPIEIPDTPTFQLEINKRRCLSWLGNNYSKRYCRKCWNRFYCHPTRDTAKHFGIQPVDNDYGTEVVCGEPYKGDFESDY
jgi:hypothetical protein